jgi:hypothetical protein
MNCDVEMAVDGMEKGSVNEVMWYGQKMKVKWKRQCLTTDECVACKWAVELKLEFFEVAWIKT